MNNDNIWVVLTTIVACVMVAWGLDTDGRYMQQATLVIAGAMVGVLLNEGGRE
jgi:hypothetical protein